MEDNYTILSSLPNTPALVPGYDDQCASDTALENTLPKIVFASKMTSLTQLLDHHHGGALW